MLQGLRCPEHGTRRSVPGTLVTDYSGGDVGNTFGANELVPSGHTDDTQGPRVPVCVIRNSRSATWIAVARLCPGLGSIVSDTVVVPPLGVMGPTVTHA